MDANKNNEAIKCITDKISVKYNGLEYDWKKSVSIDLNMARQGGFALEKVVGEIAMINNETGVKIGLPNATLVMTEDGITLNYETSDMNDVLWKMKIQNVENNESGILPDDINIEDFVKLNE